VIDPPGDLSGRTVLVTGASSGIGEETARRLAALGATVVATSRSPERGAAALERIRAGAGLAPEDPRVRPGALDLASFASIRRFAATLLAETPRLDAVVLNAGGIVDRRAETEEGFEQMFGANHLGHFLLTDLLRERLVASAPARVVVVSSVAHRWAVRGLDFGDLQSRRGRFRPFRTYGRSKLANALFSAELARRLSGTGVTVNAVHPGSVNSRFGRDGDSRVLDPLLAVLGRLVLQDVRAGARGPVLLAGSDDPAVVALSGAYLSKTRRRRPSRAARDEAAARRLWAESERLVAEHPEPAPSDTGGGGSGTRGRSDTEPAPSDTGAGGSDSRGGGSGTGAGRSDTRGGGSDSRGGGSGTGGGRPDAPDVAAERAVDQDVRTALAGGRSGFADGAGGKTAPSAPATPAPGADVADAADVPEAPAGSGAGS